MRAVNDHFVANPIHHGLFFPGGNPGHPLAGGVIVPLLVAGGFRHRYSRDLSDSPVPWLSDGDGAPDGGGVKVEVWKGKDPRAGAEGERAKI